MKDNQHVVLTAVAVLVGAIAMVVSLSGDSGSLAADDYAALEKKVASQREQVAVLTDVVEKLRHDAAKLENLADIVGMVRRDVAKLKDAGDAPAAADETTVAAVDPEQIRAAVEEVLKDRPMPPPPGEGDRRDRGRRGRIWDELGLNEEQRAKAEEAQQVMHDKMREAFRKTREEGGDFEQMGAVREEIRTEMLTALKDVLTEEQLKQYEQSMDRFGRRGPGGRGDRRGRRDRDGGDKQGDLGDVGDKGVVF